MPSWPIHIALANKLNKKLKLGDEFILGNVLPDVLDGYIFTPSNITDKNLSHYRTNRRIDYDLFLNENKNKLDNPIIFGYFVHLLVDKFYNNYTAINHFVKKDNDMYVLLNNNSMVKKDNNTLKMKQNEYIKYGEKLAYNNLLGKIINIENLSLNYLKDLNKFNYNFDDIKKTIALINKWVSNENIITDIDYKIYTEEELDSLYNNCYIFVLDYLKKLKKTD